MNSPEPFLTDPIPVKVYDEANEERILTLIFSAPMDGHINLVIIGAVTKAIVDRLNSDLAAGVGTGYLNIMNETGRKLRKMVTRKLYAVSHAVPAVTAQPAKSPAFAGRSPAKRPKMAAINMSLTKICASVAAFA